MAAEMARLRIMVMVMVKLGADMATMAMAMMAMSSDHVFCSSRGVVDGDEIRFICGAFADRALLELGVEVEPCVEAWPAEQMAAQRHHRIARSVQAYVALEVLLITMAIAIAMAMAMAIILLIHGHKDGGIATTATVRGGR